MLALEQRHAFATMLITKPFRIAHMVRLVSAASSYLNVELFANIATRAAIVPGALRDAPMSGGGALVASAA